MDRLELSGLYAHDDSLSTTTTEQRIAKEKPGSGSHERQSRNIPIAAHLEGISESEKITFENVTVLWRLNYKVEKTVATSEKLKKIIPDEEQVSVKILGHVPILYEKSIFDVPNLKNLDLSNVGLEKIEPGAFGNLPLLEDLLLYGNNLTEIKTATFTNLNVSQVVLLSNSITLLEPGVFRNLKAVSVSLDNNKLTEFSSDVFENVTLGILGLALNRLHTIAPGALSAIGLTELNLFSNNFEEIDPQIFDMQELVSLDLDSNSIKLLRPGDLRNLPELKELWLVENQLEEIPEGVFNNTKLTKLDLSNNQIAKIASKAFEDIRELTLLRLDFNKITDWDNNWLSEAKSISEISISYNLITEIPDEVLKNYSNVTRIDFRGNKIRKISAQAFYKLQHIDHLNLAYNEIDNWNPDLLGNVSIVSLDLRGNRLKCIKGDLETIFRNVQIVYLDKNPWEEECAKKIVEFQQKKKIDILVGLLPTKPIL
ncbi:leucine-rich repeat-containing protein 15-like [Zophobas morio]|uniref:leucine-rich repeat-containing protein 15-like n=1 Tax=Zophobas morio TaxID=2755281 RepID=UPI0030827AC3